MLVTDCFFNLKWKLKYKIFYTYKLAEYNYALCIRLSQVLTRFYLHVIYITGFLDTSYFVYVDVSDGDYYFTQL